MKVIAFVLLAFFSTHRAILPATQLKKTRGAAHFASFHVPVNTGYLPTRNVVTNRHLQNNHYLPYVHKAATPLPHSQLYKRIIGVRKLGDVCEPFNSNTDLFDALRDKIEAASGQQYIIINELYVEPFRNAQFKESEQTQNLYRTHDESGNFIAVGVHQESQSTGREYNGDICWYEDVEYDGAVKEKTITLDSVRRDLAESQNEYQQLPITATDVERSTIQERINYNQQSIYNIEAEIQALKPEAVKRKALHCAYAFFSIHDSITVEQVEGYTRRLKELKSEYYELTGKEITYEELLAYYHQQTLEAHIEYQPEVFCNSFLFFWCIPQNRLRRHLDGQLDETSFVTQDTIQIDSEPSDVVSDPEAEQSTENMSSASNITLEGPHSNPMYANLQHVIPAAPEPTTFVPPSPELALSNYLSLPETLIIEEEIRILYDRLFSELPKADDKIPEDIPQNTNELINVFNRLKFFARYFDIHKDKIETKRFYIENHLAKIGTSDKEILNYYDLGKKYDEAIMREAEKSQIFIEKEATLNVELDKISQVITTLIKEFTLLRDYEDSIEEDLRIVRIAIENSEAVLISEKMTTANELSHKFLNIKAGVFETLNQARIGLTTLKESKLKLDVEVGELWAVADGTYDPKAAAVDDKDDASYVGIGTGLLACLVMLITYI